MKKTLLSLLIFSLIVVGGVTVTFSKNKENSKTGGKPRENAAIDHKTKQDKKNGRKPRGELNQKTQNSDNPVINRTNVVYTYKKNGIYRIYCKEQRLTDIQLQNGETILFIGAGDTVNWQADKDVSGSGESQQAHIYLKPLRTGISTDLIINTDRHSYHCEIIAGPSFSPIISWEYPNEKRSSGISAQEPGQNDINMGGSDIRFNYRVSGLAYPWKPKMVFSDKIHVYIKMPEEMKSDEAPVLFIKEGRKVQLVNYRVRNGYYIVDRLFEKAELRCGNKKVYITRTSNRTGKPD
jgi:P-type conjugative transfer protein TrbG